MTLIKLSELGETPYQQLLGHNEQLLQSWTTLAQTIEQNLHLQPKVVEEIRRMLAHQSGCSYCKSKGKPEGSKAQFNPKELTAIGFTEVYMTMGTNIPNYLFQELYKVMTDEEIIMLIAYIQFTECQQKFGALLQLEAND